MKVTTRTVQQVITRIEIEPGDESYTLYKTMGRLSGYVAIVDGALEYRSTPYA